jgi:hypothetical protein
LEGVLKRRHGFIPGQGFPSREAEEAWRIDWRRTGEYDYATAAPSRAAAVAKWRRWLAAQKE